MQEFSIQFQRAMIITERGGIDVKNLLREVEIRESVANHFVRGRVVVEDQNNIRERFINKGNEEFKIVWKSFEKSDPKDFHFYISNIRTVETTEENETQQFAMELIDINFLKFLLKPAIQKDWVGKTKTQIFTDITRHHGVKMVPMTKNFERIDYITNSLEALKIIDDVLHYGNEPCYFYSGKTMTLTDKGSIFTNRGYKLTTDSLAQNGVRNAIKNFSMVDVIDRTEILQDGINGYRHFSFYPFEDKYELKDKKLGRTGKFELDPSLLNIDTVENCVHKTNELMMNFATFEMVYPETSMELCDTTELQVKNTEWEDEGFAEASGVYAIWEMTHRIDANYMYKQYITAVR